MSEGKCILVSDMALLIVFYLALQQTNDLITDSYCTEASVIKNGEVDDVGMKIGPQKGSQSLILVDPGNFLGGQKM